MEQIEQKRFTPPDQYWQKLCSCGWQQGVAPPRSEWIWTFAGCFVGIGLIAYLALHHGVPILIATLGASACLIFGTPAVPFAQPRNAFAGHVISAVIGVAVYQLLGTTWYSMGLCVALAVTAMMATCTIHPPAGATALIAVVTQQDWLFPLAPVGVGITILVLLGIIFNNFAMHRKYPSYW